MVLLGSRGGSDSRTAGGLYQPGLLCDSPTHYGTCCFHPHWDHDCFAVGALETCQSL